MENQEIYKMFARANKTIEKLEEQNERLTDRIAELEDESGYAWDWARHSKIEGMNLPLPRLELRYRDLGEGWQNYTATYGICYRHLLGHVVFVPLGQTKVGGNGCLPMCDGKPSLPFREGAHIQSDMKHFSLPAYSFIDGKHYEIFEGER